MAPEGTARTDAPEPQRLPAGRHQLPREFVVRSQQDRIIDAMAQLCAEQGYLSLTISDVVGRARVSRATFYEFFRDKEACFLAGYDDILARFLSAIISSSRKISGPWPDQMREGMMALLSFIAAEPAFARMCMVEVLAAGDAAIARYESAIRLLANFVDQGRIYSDYGEEIPISMATAIVGGGASLLDGEIRGGRTESVPAVLPDILYMVLVPYLGQQEALRRAAEAEQIYREARESQTK